MPPCPTRNSGQPLWQFYERGKRHVLNGRHVINKLSTENWGGASAESDPQDTCS